MGEQTTDVLAFLGGTPTRLAALKALCTGPITKTALKNQLDTSRITLWRTLSEFEERGWIMESDAGYEATAAGRIVVDRISALRTAMATVEDLADLLDWLPLEEMDFGIEHLAGAKVARPTPSDPQRPMRVATRQVEQAARFKILSHAFSPWVVDVVYDRVMAGDQSGEMITSADVLEAFVADPPIRAQLRDLIETDNFEYFQYSGSVPHILVLLDDHRVGMGVDDDVGRPQAVFDIEDEVVREWAERTYERYRSTATPVTPERFTV